jgi:hypothetical protein
MGLISLLSGAYPAPISITMNSRKAKRFSLWIVLAGLLAGAVLNCSPKRSSGGGGLDGGGGNFEYQTRDEVIKTIEQVRELMLKKPDGYIIKNPLIKAHDDLSQKELWNENFSEEQKYILGMLRKILDIESIATESDSPGFSANGYLDKIKINYAETSLCNGPGDRQYTASVNHLDRSGEICISVYELTHIPSSNLYYDIVALFAHEIAHLNGYGEADARRLQRYIVRNMKSIMREDNTWTKSFFLEMFEETNSVWMTALEANTLNEVLLSNMKMNLKRVETLLRTNLDSLRNDDIDGMSPENSDDSFDLHPKLHAAEVAFDEIFNELVLQLRAQNGADVCLTKENLEKLRDMTLKFNDVHLALLDVLLKLNDKDSKGSGPRVSYGDQKKSIEMEREIIQKAAIRPAQTRDLMLSWEDPDKQKLTRCDQVNGVIPYPDETTDSTKQK